MRKQWDKQQSGTIIRTQRGRVVSASYSQSGKPVFNSYSDRFLDLFLQPWTNVLGTVLQYSYFSIISRFPLKIVHPFRKFLAVLPSPTLYQVKTRKNILDTRVQHCLWGEGRGWTCVSWKTPQKRKSVPALLPMIVGSLQFKS